jgi:hypothetical protein
MHILTAVLVAKVTFFIKLENLLKLLLLPPLLLGGRRDPLEPQSG